MIHRTSRAAVLLAVVVMAHVAQTALAADSGGRRFPYVLYERKVTQEERERYDIRGSKAYFGPDVTLDDLIWKERSIDRSWKTIRVVVRKVMDDGEERLQVERRYLGKDLIRQRKKEEWQHYAQKNLLVDAEKYGLEREYWTPSWLEAGRKLYHRDYPDIDHLEWISEKLTVGGDNNKGVSAHLYAVPGHELDVHDFLRFNDLIKFGYSVKKTPIGPILVADAERGPRWVPSEKASGIAWIAGGNTVVYMGFAGISLETVLEMYGEKYPSTLPMDVPQDRVAWGKEEVRRALAAMKYGIENPAPPRTNGAPFGAAVMLMQKNVWCPVIPDQAELRKLDREGKIELHETIGKWWQKNQEKVYWDEDIERLAVEGSVPARFKRPMDGQR